jgi:hypothetical protein
MTMAQTEITASDAAMPGETLACLIVDDPLLRPRYGCLDYAKLLQAMKEHRFFTEIAFIPWNYRRSDPQTVRLFADNADHFALCVHGCNHLGNEFGSRDYQALSDLAAAALWRMEQHKRLTGLPYDPVMVFPQGLFSSVAMQALRDRGYLAAFNSTLRATDGDDPPAAEYRRPATGIYHDFPLFLRRYPKDKAQFVKDKVLGRPILIVEHHSAFRNGYQAMIELVDWINGLGDIRWASLANIAEHYLGVKAPYVGEIGEPAPVPLYSNGKIALRRFLSEARDNHVESSDLLAKAYKKLWNYRSGPAVF